MQTFLKPLHIIWTSVAQTVSYSRVEIIWGIAPVRPGPSYGYLSPSRSGPETGFVAIVLFLSLSYCLSNNELRRLASYYATSNFYVHEFSAFAPYVTHTTINERTHIFISVCIMYVCVYVCVYVVCTFGHFNI